jgi:hypothetical protein
MPKNLLLALREKAYEAFFGIGNQIKWRWHEFVEETRAHRKAERLKNEVSVFLATRRDHETGFPIPMTIRQVGRIAGCEDQIDLEFALQELIDEGKIRCFHIDEPNFAHFQHLENERAMAHGMPEAGTRAQLPYLDSAEFQMKRIVNLAYLEPGINFWDLSVINPSPYSEF